MMEITVWKAFGLLMYIKKRGKHNKANRFPKIRWPWELFQKWLFPWPIVDWSISPSRPQSSDSPQSSWSLRKAIRSFWYLIFSAEKSTLINIKRHISGHISRGVIVIAGFAYYHCSPLPLYMHMSSSCKSFRQCHVNPNQAFCVTSTSPALILYRI